MSKLYSIIYNNLSLPTDLCNIITSYANERVRKILAGDVIYYKYEDKLIQYQNNAVGIINNTTYIFNISYCQLYISISDIDGKSLSVIRLKNHALHIGYSNGLVCQYDDDLFIYDVVNQELKPRIHTKLDSCGFILEYADDNYIIISYALFSKYLQIYDTNLKLLSQIIPVGAVMNVALVDGVLSYYASNKWYPIKL